MKQVIQTQLAPKAIGPYSQAIRAGQTVYFSGQIPLSPETMALVSHDFNAQVTQVFTHLMEMSKSAGASLASIVKLTIYLTDLANFSIVNEVMAQFFHEPFPARTTIQVSALPKSAQIEVDAVMVL